ncbi:hypothetical protein RI367_000016 [Sorochytrium milnesiophthora]
MSSLKMVMQVECNFGAHRTIDWYKRHPLRWIATVVAVLGTLQRRHLVPLSSLKSSQFNENDLPDHEGITRALPTGRNIEAPASGQRLLVNKRGDPKTQRESIQTSRAILSA